MKREDRRPYIGGLDGTDCSNYCRDLFKHGKLSDYVIEAIKNKADKDDYFKDEELVEVEEKKINRVIGVIETKIREDLFEFARELDASREAVDKYIDGLLDAHGVPAFDPD